eukprot:CAMPEP_0172924194 /NCGR_PEP_ID=MMETSP1075-20121228/211207_1 /TAXON_ID=2916 /ORGANISM="Ceratium fusus, Strain PA161109" /LENGTH=67 /DNA_ID=CAMNT_0013784803 /DNA_START=60 /DNA_END=260 /DNA_ORIENTATION=+
MQLVEIQSIGDHECKGIMLGTGRWKELQPKIKRAKDEAHYEERYHQKQKHECDEVKSHETRKTTLLA